MKILPPILLFAALTSLIGLSFSNKASAAPPPTDKTKVRLHILPLECVLEKINNGINNIHSLTPADCKKKIKSIPRSPFDEPGGGVFVTPLSPNGDTFNTENPPEISVEDNGLNISPSILIKNLFTGGITAIFQTIVGIIVLFFIGYAFIRRFFDFL